MVDQLKEPPEEWTGPLVDNPEYVTPKQIMKLPTTKPKDVPSVDTVKGQQDGERRSHDDDADILTEGQIDTAHLSSRDGTLQLTSN